MRVICLDLSTHTGYALFENGMRIGSGNLDLNKSVHEFGPYPHCYRLAAKEMALRIFEWVFANKKDADVVVIEEINLGRDRYVQKLLENIHTAVLEMLATYQPQARIVYFDSSEWRSNLGLKMDKAQKKANAKLSKAKRAAAASGAKLDKKSLGIKGKITWKHLAVAKANEACGLTLKMKNNDEADAICLGLAYFSGAVPCDGI
jgi:Holliday junction resolvasome RuvABC endonuclease subunit